MHVIPALGRLRQEDSDFQASLDYIGSSASLGYETLFQKKKKRKIQPGVVVHACNPS
jgi:hypothetical protein